MMGIEVSLLNVRRSILIEASPEKVWREFQSFERISAWFGRGHQLHAFEPRLNGRVEMSVEIGGKRQRFGGAGDRVRTGTRNDVREQLGGVAVDLAGAHLHDDPSDAAVRRHAGRDLPPRLRTARRGRRRQPAGLRGGLGRQTPESAEVDRCGSRDAFTAIADPTRREILDLLRAHEILPAGDIAGHFSSASRPGISRHLRVCASAVSSTWNAPARRRTTR